MGSDDNVKGACGCFCFVVILTSVILFAVSFDTLEPVENGILYNNNLVSIDRERVYSNGRYFLGLGLWFISFPTTLQTIEFRGGRSLRAWSKEGQLVQIDMSLRYRLERDHVLDIYQRYDQGYHSRFENIAIRAVKQVTMQHYTQQFFTDRVPIANAMKKALRERFNEDWATVELFNLRRIDIPSSFEAKIVTKVTKAQETKTAINIASINSLRAKIKVVEGRANATISLNLANANAAAQQTVENAYAKGAAILRAQEAESYGSLSRQLGLNATALLQYRFAQLTGVMDKKFDQGLKFVVGFDSPMINVKSA